MADSTINDDDDSTLQCPICLEPFQSRIYLSPCLHSFCASCLSQWLDLTLACPMCKARPKQLHADVDTTLGTVTTIPIPGPSSPSTPEPRTPFPSSSTGQVPLREQSSWKVILKQLATKGRTAVSPSPDQTSLQGQQTRKRSRSRSCSPSSRSDTSRSRSVTPIDSYHHQYVPESLTSANNTILFEETLIASSSPSSSESRDPNPTSVTRRQVYVFGLEPIPSQDYALADRLDPIRDGPLVTPFLKRDLAVLTNVDPETADPIVVAHVSSVLFNSATGTTLGSSSSSSSSSSAATSTSRQQLPMPKKPRRAKETEAVVSPKVWDMVAQEISQWVMLDSATGETSLGMAQQFVREMRRVAVRRWKMGEWDKHVKYSKIPSSSPLSPSLPSSTRIDPTP